MSGLWWKAIVILVNVKLVFSAEIGIQLNTVFWLRKWICKNVFIKKHQSSLKGCWGKIITTSWHDPDFGGAKCFDAVSRVFCYEVFETSPYGVYPIPYMVCHELLIQEFLIHSHAINSILRFRSWTSLQCISENLFERPHLIIILCLFCAFFILTTTITYFTAPEIDRNLESFSPWLWPTSQRDSLHPNRTLFSRPGFILSLPLVFCLRKPSRQIGVYYVTFILKIDWLVQLRPCYVPQASAGRRHPRRPRTSRKFPKICVPGRSVLRVPIKNIHGWNRNGSSESGQPCLLAYTSEATWIKSPAHSKLNIFLSS